MLQGTDVYHDDPVTDWKRARKEGLDIAILKSSQGTSSAWPSWFSANLDACREAGMVVGAYHFFDPAKDGEAQGEWMSRCCGGFDGMVIPWIDCERVPGQAQRGGLTKKQYSSKVLAMALRLKSEIGRWPGIYANPDYCKNALDDRLAECELWCADYGAADAGPFGPWPSYRWRQWTDAGTVAGKKPYDLDRFDGSLEDLQAYIVGGGSEPVSVVYQGKCIDCEASAAGGVTRARVAAIAAALGLQAVDHIRSMRRVYICPRDLKVGADTSGVYAPGAVEVWNWEANARIECGAHFDGQSTRVDLTSLLKGLGHPKPKWDEATRTVTLA